MFEEPSPISTSYSHKIQSIISKLLQKNKDERINVNELLQILQDKTPAQIKMSHKNLYFNKLTTPTTNESENKKKKVFISIVTENQNNAVLSIFNYRFYFQSFPNLFSGVKT